MSAEEINLFALEEVGRNPCKGIDEKRDRGLLNQNKNEQEMVILIL